MAWNIANTNLLTTEDVEKLSLLRENEEFDLFFELCKYGNPDKIVKLTDKLQWLLSHGVSVDERDHLDRSGLMMACELNNLFMVRTLLGLGADPNAEEDDYNTVLVTPLWYAIVNNNNINIEIVRLLLEAGANPNLPVNDNILERIIEEDCDIELIKLLCRYGAKTSMETIYINSILYEQQDKIVELLKVLAASVYDIEEFMRFQEYLYQKKVQIVGGDKDEYEDLPGDTSEIREAVHKIIQDRINQLSI